MANPIQLLQPIYGAYQSDIADIAFLTIHQLHQYQLLSQLDLDYALTGYTPHEPKLDQRLIYG